MNIDQSKIKTGVWFEDSDGNMVECEQDSSFTTGGTPKGGTMHAAFPLEISERIYNDAGKLILTGKTHLTDESTILAMANSGDYSLKDAIMVLRQCCERCHNVLSFKYLNGEAGYPEYSEEWKKANTCCDFCQDEGFYYDENRSILE